MLTADGFDAAIIGVGERCGSPEIIVYDADKCVDILMEGGMDYDEAQEFFSYNTLGAYVGEHTPIYVRKMGIEEINER
jgi:hypothetical protein